MLARDNPLRVERLHALRFRFPLGDDEDALLQRVMQHGGRGAIVGPHGSGKSTVMLELATRLRREGWHVRELRIAAGQRSLTVDEWRGLRDGVGARDAILFDGAGHLWPWQWWRVRRTLSGAGCVIVAVHRVGRLPTVLRTSTSPALLRELLRDLGVEHAEPELASLLRARRGDVRAALFELYAAHARA